MNLSAYLRRNLKLRQLRLLVALDKYRYVSKVAESLNLTQPAVSKALAELEKGIGASLFYRTPLGLVPTQEGTYLIRLAQNVDEDLGRAELALQSIGQPNGWHASVGVMHSAASVVHGAFARLKGRLPTSSGFTLSLHDGPMDALIGQLRAGKLEVVIGAAPERSQGTDLEITALYSDTYVWMVRRGHPFAGLADLDLSDLSEMPWILPPRTAKIRSIIDANLRKKSVATSRTLIETVSSESRVGIVCTSDAVALVPRRMAQSAETNGVVQILDIDMSSIVMAVSAMTLLEPRPSVYVAELVQTLTETAVR